MWAAFAGLVCEDCDLLMRLTRWGPARKMVGRGGKTFSCFLLLRLSFPPAVGCAGSVMPITPCAGASVRDGTEREQGICGHNSYLMMATESGNPPLQMEEMREDASPCSASCTVVACRTARPASASPGTACPAWAFPVRPATSWVQQQR
jgi:hypothetical protein